MPIDFTIISDPKFTFACLMYQPQSKLQVFAYSYYSQIDWKVASY